MSRPARRGAARPPASTNLLGGFLIPNQFSPDMIKYLRNSRQTGRSQQCSGKKRGKKTDKWLALAEFIKGKLP